MTWHTLTPSSDDDHTCAECDLIVEDSAMRYLAIDCPAPSCTDETNAGPCVMVLTESTVACAYCGSTGAVGEVDPDDGDLDGWLAEILDEWQPSQRDQSHAPDL